MDGLMVDTESIYTDAMREMARMRDKEFTLEMKRELMGRAGIESMEIFKQRLNLQESPEDLLEERGRVFGRLLSTSKIEPMPGLKELVGLLKRIGKRRAVASSSERHWIATILLRLGLEGEFEVVVSGEDVKKGKPHPEIYLLAAKRLHLPPERCLVLEDTPVGVMAAKEAGMRCIACPNQFTDGLDFHRADLVVSSLKEIDSNLITRY